MEPIIKTDIEARVKDTGDTMTGALYVEAELGLITGSETQTTYSGMQATRLCSADDNNVNTAGFIIDSSGQAKFLHRRGNRSTVEDAYFLFNGEGYSFYANGIKGSTPVNTIPTFQALQSANRPTFKGQELALTKDINRAYILGNDTEESGTWFKLASVQLNSTYRHYRLFFTASETDSSNTPTELCIYVSTNNVDLAVGKSVTVMSQKYDDVLLNNLYILLSADTYTSGAVITAEIWFYKSVRYSSYTINNIYEMRRNNPNPYHWTFNEGNTQTPLAEPTSGYSQYKAIDILNGYTIGNSNTPIYIEKNIPKTCNQFLPLTGGTLTGQLIFNRSGTSWIGPVQYPGSNFIFSDFSSGTSSTYHSMMALKYANHTFSIGGERSSEQFGIYAYNNTRTTNGIDAGFYVSSDLNFYCSTKLYGAVWNDYAEYREYHDSDEIPYGKVVIENGDDSLSVSTKRMQPGGNIVSDTFGFSIGETDECKLPIAVSGRVLAYPYEGREEFAKNIGRPVCSGPNGTVSIMTDEEYKEKAYCCVGTISAIPKYEVWGTGEVNVNGRVWISV